MKHLNEFQVFDVKAFFKDKELVVKASKWDTKNLILKVEVAVVKDNTKYSKEGISNVYESFTVKIPNSFAGDEMKYRLGQPCSFKSISEAKVWGEFRDKLSITGELNISNE